jgi:hypothetical protein
MQWFDNEASLLPRSKGAASGLPFGLCSVIKTSRCKRSPMVKLVGHITQRAGQNVSLHLEQAAAQTGLASRSGPHGEPRYQIEGRAPECLCSLRHLSRTQGRKRARSEERAPARSTRNEAGGVRALEMRKQRPGATGVIEHRELGHGTCPPLPVSDGV